jgi:DNA-binding CsgD family transcriptional regulator
MTRPGPVGDLSIITQAFSAAALNPERWDTAMDVAARATGSVGALLLPVKGHLPRVPFSQSLGELFTAYMRSGWYQHDPRHAGVPAMMRRGVMCDQDLGAGELSRDLFHRELLVPFGFRWFAGVKVAAGDDVWCLSIQRSPAQGPLGAEDLRRLGALSENLSSAAALARTIGFARAEAASDALDLSGSAAILFDRQGEVLRINKAAEGVLRSPDLQIVKKRLVSRDRSATAALDAALHALIWRKDGTSLLPPISLPRRVGYPILAYPARLAGVAADCFAPCQAIVTLMDVGSRERTPPALLAQTFRLSPAEAKLAARLAAGLSLEQAAEELSLARETVRNQLKAIFAKTGTHRQGELIALFSRL